MNRKNWKMAAAMAVGLALMAGAANAQDPCKEPDNGTGTVSLPPEGCEYLTGDQVHEIIAGLPAGTTIKLAPIHERFICEKLGQCGSPGGTLGGDREIFQSTATFQLVGTGTLNGWTRTISVPLSTETHTGPRTPGAPVQSFPTDMYRIQGLVTGDPDFATLEIVGGTGNGFPSPGFTTLTRQPDGSFLVDSKFNVGYRIRFVGSSTGKLRGLSGTTVGKATMKAVDSDCPDAADATLPVSSK